MSEEIGYQEWLEECSQLISALELADVKPLEESTSRLHLPDSTINHMLQIYTEFLSLTFN